MSPSLPHAALGLGDQVYWSLSDSMHFVSFLEVDVLLPEKSPRAELHVVGSMNRMDNPGMTSAASATLGAQVISFHE